MGVSSVNIYEDAKSLVAAETDEAHLRTCISRFYYSVYHASNEFHSKLPTPGKRKAAVGIHENLVHMLNNPNLEETDKLHEISIEISQYLKKCLYNRRVADYGLSECINHKNLSIVMNESALVFEAIII